MDPLVIAGHRLHADFGLEVERADLRDSLAPPVWEALRLALREHALLLFRGQRLTHADMARVARQFGAASSGVKRFEAVGPAPDQAWHAVGAIESAPASATLLCVREAPAAGAGMAFTSTRALLASLPADERALLERATALHVFRAQPGRTVRWPFVVRHSAHGAPSLLLGYHVMEVDAESPLPSHLSPTALIARATAPERVHRHDLAADDVILWDNAALMHRACALRPGERRVIEEVTISGA